MIWSCHQLWDLQNGNGETMASPAKTPLDARVKPPVMYKPKAINHQWKEEPYSTHYFPSYSCIANSTVVYSTSGLPLGVGSTIRPISGMIGMVKICKNTANTTSLKKYNSLKELQRKGLPMSINPCRWRGLCGLV